MIEEALRQDGDLFWTEDYIYQALENREQIWVLRGADYSPVAGYEGLHAEVGWQTGWLDHPQVGQDARTNRAELADGDPRTVAAFLDDERPNWQSLAWFGTFALR